jgi:predicted transcriptional regulator
VKRRRHRTADTSTDGLLAVADRAPRQRQRVLDTLRAWGPMTRHELADATGLPLSSVCGRVNELMKSGAVREQIVAGRRIRKDGRYVIEAAFQTMNQRAG